MKYKAFILCLLVSLTSFDSFSQAPGNYIVLTTVSDTADDYYNAAEILAAYRGGTIVTIDPANPQDLAAVLIPLEPRYVAVVIRPIELDINFVRKFMMMSTNLDSDPFADFAYGYITGATGIDAVSFVNNIIYAESQNMENFPLNVGGYSASSLNFVYTTPGDFMMYLNPPQTYNICMETNDNGTGATFFQANTSYMTNKKLLNIGHNGDPHMLWLFEGGNMNPTPPVWNFDPSKIENPAYARVGLTSSMIGALNLFPAVAFNGACHAGEPKRVMVEGDIAATFGETNGYCEFYTMSDTFSFCLSILKTGITGYFAPCGANNANDQGEEVYNTFLFHEPLGDIHKRAMDGVVMGFLGNRPNLKLYTQGEWGYGCDVLNSGTFDPADWSGACYMLGGKANRIYFGDPLFHPYANHHSDSIYITKASIDSVAPTTLDVLVTFKKPDVSTAYYPVWDKFHHGNTRIYIPVDLPAWCSDVTSCSVIDSSGPYDLAFHAVEFIDNKTVLHLEVSIPDDMYDAINYDITFRINVLPTVAEDISFNGNAHNLGVYPNPSAGDVAIRYELIDDSEISLDVYDISGKHLLNLKNGIVRKGVYNVHDERISTLPAGMYNIIMETGTGSNQAKLVIVK